ncbi:hypothetical protein TCAL_15390, partial [Tigriopus californicus]
MKYLVILSLAVSSVSALGIPRSTGPETSGPGYEMCNDGDHVSNYLYSDPEDCHYFYSCQFNDHESHFIGYHFHCPMNTAFLENAQRCHHEEDIDTEEENAFVVEELLKLAEDDDDEKDYWIGGSRVDGEWGWNSGAPMTFVNWTPNKGFFFGDCLQLVRVDKYFFPGQAPLESFYFTPNTGLGCQYDFDNGFICEKE